MQIALYLTILDEPFQIGIYSSVCAEAAARGIDVVCIQSETMEMQGGKFPSRDFVKVDGILILSATIVTDIDLNNPDVFESRFTDVPCVSIGMKQNKMASILFRNRVSMEHLMDHLICEHHYRNFLYIGGPTKHRDNIIREHVFHSVIKKYALMYPDISSRSINCEFLEIMSVDAIRKLYQENPDNPPDVIVCANDNMAIGVFKALRLLNVQKWKNIPVTGFDDIPQAQLEIPALTTISQPLDKIGRMSVDVLCKLMAGETLPEVTLVDTELHIRNSCGCTGTKFLEKQLQLNTSNDKKTFERMKQMQYRTVRVEQALTNVSLFGQQLAVADSIDSMILYLSEFLTKLEIRTFMLLLYPEPVKEFSDRIQIVYRREYGMDYFYPDKPENVSLKRYFSRNRFPSIDDNILGSVICINHLVSGNEQIGLIMYEAQDAVQPHICSAVVFIANTVKRLKVLEDEKNRTALLEEEVALRTKELVKANRKLKKEAKLRLGVEAEVLRISELEHLRFSLDLHDDICQRLAGISMYCKSLPVKPKDLLNELSALIDDTLARTRQYAHDFFPLELDSLGLYEVLEGLCTNVQKQSGCVCKYSWLLPDSVELTTTQKINIYRIMQEAMQNVMKHSKATEVNLLVAVVDGKIIVKLQDNGVGIALKPSRISRNTEDEIMQKKSGGRHQLREGLGLRSMKYRAHQINAEYIFHSTPGVGTFVELRLPLNGDSAEKESGQNE